MSYSTVTEVPGDRITRDALTMAYTRYTFAAQYCDKGRVLEVGCGAGQGLGYLGSRARSVIGGDYTHELLTRARAHYGCRFPILRLDAERLPFRDASFDVVVLCEAIYYLADAPRFVDEARRILVPRGILVVTSVNKEWIDFNPSPFAIHYFSAPELRALLEDRGFRSELFVGFPVRMESIRDYLVSFLKRSAVRLGLIPRTMKGKELLKRIFLGPVTSVPPEITNATGTFEVPTPMNSGASVRGFKVLYAVGRAR